MLLKPRYLVLDTSHLNQWADAKTSARADQRAQAEAWEAWLDAQGYVVLFCLHHISEMANHVEDIAAKRLRFLSRLPFVAWIGSPPDRTLGAVVTVLGEEIRAALLTGGAWREIRDLAKPRLIQVGTGEAMLGAPPEAWMTLRPEFAAQAEHDRVTVAFSRLGTVDIANKPMSELMKGRLRQGQDLRRHLDLMQGSFAAHISERGDQRIQSPQRVAEAFMERVEDMAGSASTSASDLVFRALAVQGVGAEDITPDATVGQMLTLGLFRAQTRMIAEGLGLNDVAKLRALRPEQVPNWTLAQALERHLPDVPLRQGSELNDSHLLGLSAYADLTLVDKRTLEGVRRLRQKEPNHASLLGRVERAAGLLQIMKLDAG